MVWRPILEDEEAERARFIAVQISDAVADAPDDSWERDSMRLLLDAYVARALESERHAERALVALEISFKSVRPGLSPGLFGGLAGLGWVATHIRSLLADWIEPDDDGACIEIDTALLRSVRSWTAASNYDLISGLAGIALYALERVPRSDAEQLLCMVIDRLAACAEETETGTTWHTPPQFLPEHQRQFAPEGYYNLGVAHGVPAIALVLARTMRAGLRRDEARTLLEGLVRWIMKQQNLSRGGSGFPAWIAHGVTEPPGASNMREAWCYGGLGLSVTMLGAARTIANAEWEQAALRVARLEAERSPEGSGVVDMCLCHGGAGNAHLYNRLYQATGERAFFNAARRWLGACLATHTIGTGTGGYLFRRTKDQRNPLGELAMLPDSTFLGGSSGVAIALLAAATALEPAWDRVLMADLRPTS